MAGFRLRVLAAGRLDLVNVDAEFLIHNVFFTGAMGFYAAEPLTIQIEQDGQIMARHEYKPPVIDIDDETEF